MYYILMDQTVIKHYFVWSHGIWRKRVMCTCTTFCWIRQLFTTNMNGLVVFVGRELFVLILHSAGSDSYLTYFDCSRDIWSMCTSITFCWIRQLSNTTLTGPVTFGVCVLVLHYAGSDSYLTYFDRSRDIWSMCTSSTFCWIGQLSNIL